VHGILRGTARPRLRRGPKSYRHFGGIWRSQRITRRSSCGARQSGARCNCCRRTDRRPRRPGRYENDPDELLGEVAAALGRAAPDAIVAAGPIAARAAQAATKTILILAASDDMVGDGLVPSMRRPGGNTTGVSLLAPELDGKRQFCKVQRHGHD